MFNETQAIAIVFVIIIFLYFIGSYFAATIAIKKGQSGCLFFILSLIINPIFTIIIALLLNDRYKNE